MEYTSELCLETIEYLRKAGKTDNSFSEAFPYIHHFKKTGGDATMESFIDYCKVSEIKGQTNTNVCRRLLDLKQQVEEFITTIPDSPGISSIKYQNFAKNSVEKVPF